LGAKAGRERFEALLDGGQLGVRELAEFAIRAKPKLLELGMLALEHSIRAPRVDDRLHRLSPLGHGPNPTVIRRDDRIMQRLLERFVLGEHRVKPSSKIVRQRDDGGTVKTIGEGSKVYR
jgi:hypothetical protein